MSMKRLKKSSWITSESIDHNRNCLRNNHSSTTCDGVVVVRLCLWYDSGSMDSG